MATLPYAAPTTQLQASALVSPTKRTLLLLILTTATFYWLHTRHDPWRLTATFRSRNADWDSFELADDYLVSSPKRSPFQTWDTRTGKHLYTSTLSPLQTNTTDSLVCNGRYFLRWNPISRDVLLISTVNGAVFKSGTMGDYFSIADLRSDLAAIYIKPIHSAHTVAFQTGVFHPFDPTRCATPFKDFVFPIRTQLSAHFSPDGRTIIYSASDDQTGWNRSVTFADAQTGRHTLTVNECRLATTPVSRDGSICTVITATPRMSSRADFCLDRYSVLTGDRLSSTPLYGPPPAVCELASDGNTAFIVSAGPGPRLNLYDLKSSTSVWALPVFNANVLCTFPDNNRFLAPAYNSPNLVIYGRESFYPLAHLPNQPAPISQAKISPKGQTIALISNNTIHLYNPTGPDCPESTLGLLAFPHTWLLLALLIATTLSLRIDAARHAPPHAHHLLSLAILLATLPRTFHFLISAALGHLLLTPAPLLLLAAIALRTGANFWRWTTFTLLALQLPLNLLCLHTLRARGPNATTPILLDRTWHIPNLPLLIILPLLTFAILPALYHLARPPQHTP